MSAVCPACKTENPEGHKFCGECGRPLARLAPTPELRPPGHLAEKILHGRPALEGERKQVTVLFADVKGSMELQEDLDPEEWAGIMARFFALLSDGVHRFEGTVDKFTGDGVMALFGAPIAHEDHARRACQAALHLAQAVSAYADELRRTKGLSFSVRLGLNSGEVVVGGIGDDARMEYTALGHTVGLAQRMESLAEPGRAYLTEHTAALVGERFRLRDLGRIEVKGTKEPVGVFVLEGTAHRTWTSDAARRRALSPLVGRAEEMASLERALALAREGQTQVVGVVGEPGVGKSRLCEELARAAVARGLTVRRTAGVSHARAVPLLPVLELFRDYYDITDADSPASAREKIAGRLLLLDPAFGDDLPLLFDFLEIPDPDRPPPRLGPDARMRRIFEIVRRVTQRRSERETLVLLLEDLHWLDPQSEVFLEQLVSSYPGTRTLVLANFRPGFEAPWAGEPYYRQLPLQPLAADAVRQLLAALLGPDPSLVPLPEHVIERTGGNPFFTEEVVRSLIDDGVLEGEPGAYRLTRPLDDVGVPPTVQAVLAARIDRLPEREKAVLQTAAVIGRTFPQAVLQLVDGSTDGELAGIVGDLCAAEFLVGDPTGRGAEYRFWHPLTQEVAYHSLLAERRRRLHAAVARALVELDPDRLDERAALVASHFERAGDDLESARWNARAAVWVQRSNIAEGERRWLATVAHLGNVPETEETLALGALARARLLQFGSRRGISPEEAERLFTEGRALAERLADPEPLIAVTRFYTTAQLMWGEVDKALAGLLEVCRLGDETGDPDVRAGLWSGPSITYTFTGPLGDGLRATDTVLGLCQGNPDRGAKHLGYSPMTLTLLSRARILARMGRLAEARQVADETLTLARRRSELEWVTWTLATYADLADWTGEDHEAPARATEALRIAEESESVFIHIVALYGLGVAELVGGRWDEAAVLLGRALAEARAHRTALWKEPSLLARLARAHLGQADPEAARERADEAVSVARRQGARVVECLALLTRAQVLRATEGAAACDPVAADLTAALALIAETGTATFEPFVREELGRLRADESELREALRLYSAIDATGHARRLEAELAGAQIRTAAEDTAGRDP